MPSEGKLHGDGSQCRCPTERFKPGDRVRVIRPGDPFHGELLEIVISEWPEEAKRSKANTCCYQVRTIEHGHLTYMMPDELELVAQNR
jgi:hypothetical protein